jgi:hypothetical protein
MVVPTLDLRQFGAEDWDLYYLSSSRRPSTLTDEC